VSYGWVVTQETAGADKGGQGALGPLNEFKVQTEIVSDSSTMRRGIWIGRMNIAVTQNWWSILVDAWARMFVNALGVVWEWDWVDVFWGNFTSCFERLRSALSVLIRDWTTFTGRTRASVWR